MIAFLIFVVVLLALVVTFEYGLPCVEEWFRRRQIVREHALEADLKALTGAQQLALLAWKARHQMYDLVSESSYSDDASTEIRERSSR